MLKQRNYNEMVTYILDKIREMDISEDDKKTLFAYITSLESKYFMEMGDAQQWIPCSERLPEDDGEYLVWMRWDFEDEPSYSIVNYDANTEAFGEWHEYFDKYTLGSLGSDFEEIKGVIAWMPLPEPWKGDE